MSEHIVTYERKGTVGLALLDAPRRNALTPALADAVLEALDTAAADPEVTSFVIAGRGPGFCSGADLVLLERVGQDPLQEENYDGIGRIYTMFARLLTAPIPPLAAVHGAVVGAGINLALACDLRLVADDVRIIGFGRAAAHPGGGHLSMLARRIASNAGPAIALFGQELDARTAVSCGFAWASVPREDLLGTALDIAAGAGEDGRLARVLTQTYRAAAAHQLDPAAAILLERAPQLWSLRRRLG